MPSVDVILNLRHFVSLKNGTIAIGVLNIIGSLMMLAGFGVPEERAVLGELLFTIVVVIGILTSILHIYATVYRKTGILMAFIVFLGLGLVRDCFMVIIYPSQSTSTIGEIFGLVIEYIYVHSIRACQLLVMYCYREKIIRENKYGVVIKT